MRFYYADEKKKGEKSWYPPHALSRTMLWLIPILLTEVMDPAIGTQIVVASGDAGIVGQDGPRVP